MSEVNVLAAMSAAKRQLAGQAAYGKKSKLAADLGEAQAAVRHLLTVIRAGKGTNLFGGVAYAINAEEMTAALARMGVKP